MTKGTGSIILTGAGSSYPYSRPRDDWEAKAEIGISLADIRTPIPYGQWEELHNAFPER